MRGGSVAQSDGQNESSNRQRPVSGGHRGGLIVYVDDDADSRYFAKEVIEAAGYSFLGVSSGADCLALLQRTNPRIILLDIVMPDMDGYETCRRIRLHFPLLRARVIYVTALSTPEDVTRALGTDADDYIVKPYRAERLRERVQHWLREGPRELDD